MRTEMRACRLRLSNTFVTAVNCIYYQILSAISAGKSASLCGCRKRSEKPLSLGNCYKEKSLSLGNKPDPEEQERLRRERRKESEARALPLAEKLAQGPAEQNSEQNSWPESWPSSGLHQLELFAESISDHSNRSIR